MKSWTKPTNEMVDKVLLSVKKETDRQYFFSRLNNPLWISHLVEKGYFKSPPGLRHLPDGSIQYPSWPELAYLINISEEATDNIIEIILGFSKTDNPRIYDGIIEIALKLKGGDSAKLLSKIIESTELKHQFSSHHYPDLLCHWVSQDNIDAALEVVKKLIPFQENPELIKKANLRRNNSAYVEPSPEPTPRFSQWEYQKILEKGIRPLAEHEPYQVARILIDATASMIRLRIYQEDLDKIRDEDYSEIWCRRLDSSARNHRDSKEVLVHTLTYACEQVFEKNSDLVEALDQALRNQRWQVFKRLRQHLYSLHPNEQTLPWIREFILGQKDYSKWKHHYEFQLMVRIACEHFDVRLLSEDERTVIFDDILSGPSMKAFREMAGDEFSEEVFLKRQRYFHRKQLHPFATLLYGQYRQYFDELESEHQDQPLSDEDYSPYGDVSGGLITHQSPKSDDELATLSDEELLAYLNEWDEVRRNKDNWLIEINITALAGVFQTLFKENIVPDATRLSFWMKHRENIERPVYIAAMAKAIQAVLKEQNFDGLDQWIEFCEWILTHPETDLKDGKPEPSDESAKHPDWGSSRRTVIDFIDTCLNEDVNVPYSARGGLVGLLNKLCTQFDSRLDQDRPVILNRDDPISEAVNNTRSRALDAFFKFGFWVRRYFQDDVVPEVTEMLQKRLADNASVPLTIPEHALLGMRFGSLCGFNKDWALENKKLLFPQENMFIWLDAFGSFLRFNGPSMLTFDILKQDYEFALDHLHVFAGERNIGRGLVDRLGQHLFSYYLWQVYPLTGEQSLLECFYKMTEGGRQSWAHLFDHVGRSLNNSGKHLDSGLIERIIAFFDWRLEACEALELQEFTFWLDAECMDAEWRLGAYSKTLDLDRVKYDGLSIEIDTLNKLLSDHLSQVVECFKKITDSLDQGSNLYILANDVTPILKAGLSSEDSTIRENAECARENLLRIGRFDFRDME